MGRARLGLKALAWARPEGARAFGKPKPGLPQRLRLGWGSAGLKPRPVHVEKDF
jgi:hypothetical protein